jgi:crotonobetainyl-CoA:carnitine CoA-transferase CaiB-like acyl-CoA transferase
MLEGGALQGLRVLDYTDAGGRLAGKLLAEAGADVVRLRREASGPPMAGAAAARGGLLDWWYDAGVSHAQLDLESEAGRQGFMDLAAHADLLIETEPPGRLAGLGLDYPNLERHNPRLVHLSLTPFGRQGPRAGWQVSDLVAAALGGPLSVGGDPDRPLNGWGRQAFNVGALFAAVTALAGVHGARASGLGQHIDCSLHEAVISCTEQVLMFWFFRDLLPTAIAPRQGSLHWSGGYEVMAGASGQIMVTPTPNALALVEWLAEEGRDEAADLLSDIGRIRERIAGLMSTLRAWVATKDAHALFLEAQRRHMPFGEVLTPAEAAAGPQLRARGFFRAVAWDGPEVRTPGPLFRLLGTPAPAPKPPPSAPAAFSDLLARWQRDPDPPDEHHRATATRQSDKALPLAGVRVLDFTWVLAGPFATRIFADLGADVIKLQTEVRAQGAGGNEHPYFVMWNRGKRSAALNMKHPRGVEVFRRLIEQSDLVFDNFSAGVLDRLGIGYEAAKGWNERVIYVNMTGTGRDGPWRDFVTYAPTVHALSGLTSLTNPPGRRNIGLGISLSDHVSGLAGALAALEALEARRRSGRGQLVDLSQLEVSSYLIGPALLDLIANGREAQPQGNQDAFDDFAPNEVYRCGDGEWLAVTARDDQEWRRLCGVIESDELGADEGLATVEGRRARRAEVDAALARWTGSQAASGAMRRLQAVGVPAGMVQNARHMTDEDEQLAARAWLTYLDHPVRGRHAIDRYPARFSRTPLDQHTAAPVFGQHSFEVYRTLLGMSDEEIAIAVGEGLFA